MQFSPSLSRVKNNVRIVRGVGGSVKCCQEKGVKIGGQEGGWGNEVAG